MTPTTIETQDLGPYLSDSDNVDRVAGVANDLWDLLDDIDTVGDMCKPISLDGFKEFYELTIRICELRHTLLASDGFDLHFPTRKQ